MVLTFAFISEFQFVPLPDTNPVLIGHRWKEYHEVRASASSEIEAAPTMYLNAGSGTQEPCTHKWYLLSVILPCISWSRRVSPLYGKSRRWMRSGFSRCTVSQLKSTILLSPRTCARKASLEQAQSQKKQERAHFMIFLPSMPDQHGIRIRKRDELEL